MGTSTVGAVVGLTCGRLQLIVQCVGDEGQLGHEDKTKIELCPRLVEQLCGCGIKKVKFVHSQ